MTDVDPIVGPGHTDKLFFIVPDEGVPYTSRVTYEQVDKGTPDAVTLPWIEDTDKWWVPLQHLSEDELTHSVTEAEWNDAMNALGSERQNLVYSTLVALVKAGLTTEQANLLLEGK